MITATKQTKTQRRDAAILKHGFELQRIFPSGDGANLGPVDLYRAILKLEREAHRLAERECNEQLPEGYSERKEASILERLDALIGYRAAGVPVFLNGDPRGYSLKIQDAWMKAHNDPLYRDWGGYGILAPDEFN